MIVTDGSIEHAIYGAMESDAWANIEVAIAGDERHKNNKRRRDNGNILRGIE